MPTAKNQASDARLQLLSQIKELHRQPFTDPYRRLIAAVEIQTAVVIMGAPSTVHIYTSVTGAKMEKLPATMFPKMPQLRSAKESTLGLNCRIVCANLPL